MNILKSYIEYLKDNPKGYWFKRKLYGWGWTPATHQGWLVTLIFVILILALAFNVDESATGRDVVFGLFLPLLVLIAIIIRVSYAKGEKPKWQWGLKRDKNKKN